MTKKIINCPCCKRPFDPGVSILVDNENNRVIVEGQVINLTLYETALMRLLVKTIPRTVPYSAIHEVLWPGDRFNERKEKSLHVRIHHLRKKLEATAWEIRAVNRLGYALQRTDIPTVQTIVGSVQNALRG